MPIATDGEQCPRLSIEFMAPRNETRQAYQQSFGDLCTLARDAMALRAIDYFTLTSSRRYVDDPLHSVRIASDLQAEIGVPVVPHVRSLYLWARHGDELARLCDAGELRRVLVIRGDLPDAGADAGVREAAPYPYAIDLIRHLQAACSERLTIITSCYPEGHAEATTLDEDIAWMVRKMQAGAEHCLSQFFFNADTFAHFLARARLACEGEGVPCAVTPGVLPVVSARRVARAVATCGARRPEALLAALAALSADAQAAHGLRFTLDLIAGLLRHSDRIHLYSLNSRAMLLPLLEAMGGG